MARVLVTGSADGLGRAAAESLLDNGHKVVVHARCAARLGAVADLVDRGAATVVGDLADEHATRGVAEQVNGLRRMDAVIHNAGVMSGLVVPVNVVAAYLLTVLLRRPSRLVYLSSSMHRGGRPDVTCLAGSGSCSYSDSKLLVTALALAVARRWPDVRSNAGDEEALHSTAVGQPGLPYVEVHPVDRLHLEDDVIVEDISDAARYGHCGLRSTGGQ